VPPSRALALAFRVRSKTPATRHCASVRERIDAARDRGMLPPHGQALFSANPSRLVRRPDTVLSRRRRHSVSPPNDAHGVNPGSPEGPAWRHRHSGTISGRIPFLRSFPALARRKNCGYPGSPLIPSVHAGHVLLAKATPCARSKRGTRHDHTVQAPRGEGHPPLRLAISADREPRHEQRSRIGRQLALRSTRGPDPERSASRS
jgi:hypothetical protein